MNVTFFNYKAFLFFTLWFQSFVIYSQTNISITLKQIPNKANFTIHLQEYIDGDFIELDQQNIISEDSTVIVKLNNPGLSKTKLLSLFIDDGINKVEFLHNPNEPNLQISTWYFGLKNGDIFFNDSHENEAYSQLLKTMSEYHSFLETFEKEAITLSVFDKTYKKSIIEIEEKIEKLQLLLNVNLEKIEIKFPNTYTVNTLIPLNKIPIRQSSLINKITYDSYLSFLNEHYFDYVNFNDADLLNHYGYRDKILYYLSTFVDKNTTHIEKGLATIFSNTEMNDQVYNYTFNELMKLFISLENEHLLQFLSDNYGSGCSLDLPIEDLKKLYSIQHTKIGSNATELLLFDNKHKAKSLLETSKVNEITVVYFWLSWCAHCKKTTPQLRETYDLLHKKGLEVYAVSLDENESDWLASISENKTNWINVAELTPLKNSAVAKNYNLSKTPSVFVLNKKGEIIAKNLFGKDLQDFLESQLK